MFSPVDYGVFFCMITLSCLIGIYFGCIKKNQNAAEYLLGGSKMNVLPVGISLIVSHVSGVTLVGVPADIYYYGVNFSFFMVAFIIGGLLSVYLYLPVIVNIKVPSGFEYLNLRFNKSIRNLASFLFVVQMVMLNPIYAYLPAIALSQFTGIHSYLIAPVVCLICMFYTTVGGLKAVIWTDVLQFFGMVVTMLIVLFVGIKSLGGFGIVWSRAYDGQRLSLDIDPTIRDGFWPTIMGGSIQCLNALCFHPSSIQKYLSTSTLKNARHVIVIETLGIVSVFSIAILTGLVLFAKYENCDPLSSGLISKPDQILLHFFTSVAGHVPGLPGIFIAGIFSAALSSISTSLNTLSATVYGDFIVHYIPKDTSPRTENNILKLIVVVFGIIFALLSLVIEHLGSLLTLVISSHNCIGGLLVGIYSLGLLFPTANSKGALWGGIISFVVTFWIATGSLWYKLQGAFDSFIKPLSVEGCDLFVNSTVSNSPIHTQPFILYRLSYWYSGTIAVVVVMTVGLLVSAITKSDNKNINWDLISPATHFIMKLLNQKHEVNDDLNFEEAEEMITYKDQQK